MADLSTAAWTGTCRHGSGAGRRCAREGRAEAVLLADIRRLPATRPPTPQTDPLPCQIVGLNGKQHERPADLLRARRRRGPRAAAAGAHHAAAALRPVPLARADARRWRRRPCAAGDPHAALLGQRARSDVPRRAAAGGGDRRGETIGHVETELGLFLFPPAGRRTAACAACSCRAPPTTSCEHRPAHRRGAGRSSSRATPAADRAGRGRAARAAQPEARRHPADAPGRLRPSSCSRPSSARRRCRWCASARR